MYTYDAYDKQMLEDRINQFRDQTKRFLAGKLTEEQFLPLRLQNGLYIQRLAPMLRVAVPYGCISSTQLRKLASISRDYDKGYAHLSTRQNVQYNWPILEQVPELLAELAEVEMHAIQTSGNCIRNTTTDQYGLPSIPNLPICPVNSKLPSAEHPMIRLRHRSMTSGFTSRKMQRVKLVFRY